MKPLHKPVCVVAGVGPSNGEALVRVFAEAGHSVAMLARRPEKLQRLAASMNDVHGFPCDLTDEASLHAAFKAIEAKLGLVETFIYNAGKGIWGTIENITAEQFEMAWRVNTLGFFLCAQHVIPAMVAAGHGSIIAMGATASLRGVAGTAAFAPAKAAQRTLAQSMARHLGPKGVHIAHIVVDGVVGGPETRSEFPHRPDDAFIDPIAIAKTALDLARQPRSAWSFEVDLRPFNEKW